MKKNIYGNSGAEGCTLVRVRYRERCAKILLGRLRMVQVRRYGDTKLFSKNLQKRRIIKMER